MKLRIVSKLKESVIEPDPTFEYENDTDGPVDDKWQELMSQLTTEKKSFPGHKGRPGKRGGSLPKSGSSIASEIVKDPMQEARDAYWNKKGRPTSFPSSLTTNDYQKRNGGPPRSGVPDIIEVYGDGKDLGADFYDTSELGAKMWIKSFLSNKGYDISKVSITSERTDDDWVAVTVNMKDRK